MVRTSFSLLSQVEVLILPRIVSIDGFLMCPNFRALPDMVKLNAERKGRHKGVSIIAPVMEVSGPGQLESVAGEISGALFKGHARNHEQDPSVNKPAPQGLSGRDIPNAIALLGHSYVLTDSRLNNHVPDILQLYGLDIVTAQEIDFKQLTELAQSHDYYAKKLYWRSARETLGAFLYFTLIRRPAGIIHLMPFNCGVDALLRIELMALHKRLNNAPPYMVIVCDEHTQRDHVVTRVEAFLDIVHGIKIK
jgi:predicted nucleotide-binding protein (sugar kinase/HSP70/actin superfamily)